MSPTTSRATTPAAQPDDWRTNAPCRSEDPELFFPIGTSGPALVQIEQAKAVCRRCPVMERCLQWALETRQDFGVWGGLSEDERLRRSGRRRWNQRRMDGLTQTENILQNRLGELRALEASMLPDVEIARRMGTNAQTIVRVRNLLAAQNAAEGAKAG